jgi:hypothetical protein
MANDKDFVVAGAVEVGKDTKVTLGTVTSNNIDLATGNYFADTPTGASTYTISNAGDVQSFQLEVTGGTAEVAQNFSTTLYTGTGTTQTITNNIDLAGDGGIVWVKCRSDTADHRLIDTDGGANNILTPNANSAYFNNSTIFSSFNSDGFSVATDVATNGSGRTYVSWAFKKEPSFFDVVTYTGVDAPQTISHNLGSIPGCIIVKRTDTTDDWAVYHRGIDATSPQNYWLKLNNTDAREDYDMWYDTAPTATEFSVRLNGTVNEGGGTYVAYLFAHDDAADGLIQCGSFTTDGSGNASVTLGWEPQWFLVKRADGADSWYILDSIRGFTETSDKALQANTSDNEVSSSGFGYPTSTGWSNVGDNSQYFTNSTYIYIAIRAASDLDLTWPSSIEWAGGIAPSAPATGETDVFTLSTDDGGTTYVGVKTADNLS